jgi:Resolvase, N terminal domain
MIRITISAEAYTAIAATLRCAVYTRVSTEHGLEQEFNSLDNQREASEAYVKSQAHEGWKLIRTRYDDGGYSGGSMDRPALKRLLDDVRARRIDMIVVYKVDRLTRSGNTAPAAATARPSSPHSTACTSAPRRPRSSPRQADPETDRRAHAPANAASQPTSPSVRPEPRPIAPSPSLIPAKAPRQDGITAQDFGNGLIGGMNPSRNCLPSRTSCPTVGTNWGRA